MATSHCCCHLFDIKCECEHNHMLVPCVPCVPFAMDENDLEEEYLRIILKNDTTFWVDIPLSEIMKFEKSHLAFIVRNTQNNNGYRMEVNSDKKTLTNIAILYKKQCWTMLYSNEYKLDNFEGVSGTANILDFLGLKEEDFQNVDENVQKDIDREEKKRRKHLKEMACNERKLAHFNRKGMKACVDCWGQECCKKCRICICGGCTDNTCDDLYYEI